MHKIHERLVRDLRYNQVYKKKYTIAQRRARIGERCLEDSRMSLNGNGSIR